ncbi:unnamed protein product, partial [Gulo gulo]
VAWRSRPADSLGSEEVQRLHKHRGSHPGGRQKQSPGLTGTWQGGATKGQARPVINRTGAGRGPGAPQDPGEPSTGPGSSSGPRRRARSLHAAQQGPATGERILAAHQGPRRTPGTALTPC